MKLGGFFTAMRAARRGDLGRRDATTRYKPGVVTAAALVGALLAPALASAHIERASYWPDPAPDCSVSPCAGGEVPTARSLASVFAKNPGPGVTRVVCQPDSMKRVRQSIKAAETVGYVLRPTQPRVKITEAEGTALRGLNAKLFN